MGLSHIPEDRHKHGLVLDYSLEDNLILQTYKTLKENGVELITANDGKKAMVVLDKALAKWEEK